MNKRKRVAWAKHRHKRQKAKAKQQAAKTGARTPAAS